MKQLHEILNNLLWKEKEGLQNLGRIDTGKATFSGNIMQKDLFRFQMNITVQGQAEFVIWKMVERERPGVVHMGIWDCK